MDSGLEFPEITSFLRGVSLPGWQVHFRLRSCWKPHVASEGSGALLCRYLIPEGDQESLGRMTTTGADLVILHGQQFLILRHSAWVCGGLCLGGLATWPQPPSTNISKGIIIYLLILTEILRYHYRAKWGQFAQLVDKKHLSCVSPGPTLTYLAGARSSSFIQAIVFLPRPSSLMDTSLCFCSQSSDHSNRSLNRSE